MSANYPGAAPSFTPVVDGVDYPKAIDITALQDEIAAMGGALVSSGLAHDLDPSATADDRDLGSTSKQWRALHVKRLNLAAASELTVASGAVTATQSVHTLDTEADAASDDLDTITAGSGVAAGTLLILRAEDPARVVTVKDGTGNLLLNGDCALSATDRTLTLLYDGTNWREQARSVPLIVDAIASSGGKVTQIAFAASQSASTDANTLDDYEEGTWTPTDGSGAGLSFSSVEGHYVKVGQMVTVAATLTYPSTANSNNAVISGLPFTVQNSSNSLWLTQALTTNNSVIVRAIKNTTTAELLTTTSETAWSNANMSTRRITFTLTYRATA